MPAPECPFNPELRSHGSLSVAEQRDELLEAELIAADACNRDPGLLPLETEIFYKQALEFYESTLNAEGRFPYKAGYWAVRRTRRIPMRVASDIYCRALLPNATEIIQPSSKIVSEAVGHKIGASSNGARGRGYEGFRAAVKDKMLSLLMRDTIAIMFDPMPSADREALFSSYTDWTTKERRLAALASEELFGHPIDAKLLNDPFADEITLGRTVGEREREYAFIAGSMETDLVELFRTNNAPSQAEFLATATTDLSRAFAAADCPRDERYPTSLRHIELLGSLATLTATKAGRLVFKQPHRNLWQVYFNAATGFWDIAAASPPLTNNPLDHEHRCPGPDPLPAKCAEHEERAVIFSDAIRKLSHAHDEVIDPQNISAATVIAGFGVGVSHHTQRMGHLPPA